MTYGYRTILASKLGGYFNSSSPNQRLQLNTKDDENKLLTFDRILDALRLYTFVLRWNMKEYSSDCPYARMISLNSFMTSAAALDIKFRPRTSFGFSYL